MSFDRFAEIVAEHAARPWAFALALAAVLAWLPTLALLDPGISDLIVDSITNPVSLLLLVLLHNSTHRAERAGDARSDQLAAAISVVLDQLARWEQDSQRSAYLEGRARRLVEISRQESAFQAGRSDDPAPGKGDPSDRTG